MIKLIRVYDAQHKNDGTRFLVERLWPRGVKKSALPMTAWLKDAAPSTGLRKWFDHDPAKWEEFEKRYFAELDASPDGLEPVLKAARHGPVTFLYSSHDTEQNNAIALKNYVEAKLSKSPKLTRAKGRKTIR